MPRGRWIGAGWLLIGLLAGCAKHEAAKTITAPVVEPIGNDSSQTQFEIISARYGGTPIIPFESVGDIWMSTWGDDDLLYVTWGDGEGPGQSTDNPVFATDAGVAALEGTVPLFGNVSSPFECVRSINVPDGIGWGSGLSEDDKPSSLLCCDGKLYFAGHTPLGDPDYGYIATSDDHGLTWTEAPNSPWTKAVNSPFRILMLINMGKNYELNEDGYVYALGIGHEWSWPDGTVRLGRVAKDKIAEYEAFEYYSGNDEANNPTWSSAQTDAIALDEINATQLGSAFYHEGSGQYLFMSMGGIYAAGHPWGPWAWVRFDEGEFDPSWAGGYMPGVIAKGAGLDYFYFTLAGQDSVIGYFCHIGKIQLELAETP